jgi:hypothetical protein
MVAAWLKDNALKPVISDVLKEARAQIQPFENRKLSFETTCDRNGAIEFDRYLETHPNGGKTKFDIDREIALTKEDEKKDMLIQTQTTFSIKKKFCQRVADHGSQIIEAAVATHKAEDAKWGQEYSERRYVTVMRETIGWLRGIRLARDIQHPREMFSGLLDL